MARKTIRPPKLAGEKEGFVVRGPDGKLYFVPIDALENFRIPEPLQPGVANSAISKRVDELLKEGLEKGKVLDLTDKKRATKKFGKFVVVFGR